MNDSVESACSPALARLLRLLSFGVQPDATEVVSWSPEDWDATALAAADQGLSPLLYRRLVDGGTPAPDAVVARLRRHYLRVAAANTRRFAALEEALLALDAAGIQVILLKGAYLAPMVYGNIALRPMVDLDLLVHSSEAERAASAMAALGYRPSEGEAWMRERYGHQGLKREDGHLLELHQHAGAFAVGARMDQARLWQRAQPVQIGDAAALALEPTDLLLHLCVHSVSHHLFQLGVLPLYDVGQLLSRMGTQIASDDIVQRARDWHVARGVYLALALAQRLLQAPVDPLLLADLAPPDGLAVRALVESLVLAKGHPPSPSPNLVALWGEQSWRSRLATIGRVLVPDAQRMRALYSVGADRRVWPWLYLRRWADLLTHRGVSVRQLVGRPADSMDWQTLVRWLSQG